MPASHTNRNTKQTDNSPINKNTKQTDHDMLFA